MVEVDRKCHLRTRDGPTEDHTHATTTVHVHRENDKDTLLSDMECSSDGLTL